MTLITDKAKLAQLQFEKKGMANPPKVRVANAMDVSGSMQSMFSNGTVQGAFDQLLGAALRLDDNGEIDAYVFDTRVKKIGTASSDDAGTFVRKRIMPLPGIWGGTNYAPPLEAIMDDMFGAGSSIPTEKPKGGMFGGLFGKKPDAAPTTQPGAVDNTPVVVFFITDGDASDTQAADVVFKASASRPIYWHIVGLGNAGFRYLQKAADDFDNVGFIRLNNFKLSDQEMYETLFTDEFITWCKANGGS